MESAFPIDVGYRAIWTRPGVAPERFSRALIWTVRYGCFTGD
ncbi:hypothetical protein SAMN04489764_3383 [Thermostaphylospora chromogena]|uniref:Uncharacterized protein n=1 Tax=Thermostaphylospora chromogena TaxID=35622 RepID=A0A1H1G6C2_9ACTN|nr:hypothetical protein SAMN04489764_3383 [Thermostaphylospora chromogena]